MQELQNIVSKIQNSNNTLFILCGFPYSGKSYVASQLQSQTNIQIVSIDDIFNAKGFDWNSNVLPGENEWTEIFDESYEKVKNILLSGNSVLYDSTNQTLASRNILRDIVTSVGADTVVIYVNSSIGTIWERWENNQKDPVRSVVSKDLVQMTIEMFEVPTSDESVLTINN